MTLPWIERTPNPHAHLVREDGRVCLYKQRLLRTRTKTDLRRVERLLTYCKDEITPLTISGATFYPTSTEEPVTCVRCLTERDKPTKPTPSKAPYMPY